jgi:hypothetical protein
MADKFNPEQFSVPSGFPEILKDLNREILRAQPKDIYQFCAAYFSKKLTEQRTKPADTTEMTATGKYY